MNDPAIYLSLEHSFIGYLLIPLLLLLALDSLGRLAIFSLARPVEDNWLNRILIKRRLKHSGLQRQLLLRGIQPEKYMNSQLIAQLGCQLDTCQRCEASSACRNSHQSGQSIPPLSHCPNGSYIWPLLER